MNSLFRRLVTPTLRILKVDQRGQDLVEYALMAGFVTVTAGAVMPGGATVISQIFVKLASVLARSNGVHSG